MSILAPWSENDQTELDVLRNVPIKMAGISHGCFLVQRKRYVERAYQKMSVEEKVDFKWNTAEIDKAGADDGSRHHLVSPLFSLRLVIASNYFLYQS